MNDTGHALDKVRDMNVNECQSNFYIIAILVFFCKLTTSFVGIIFWRTNFIIVVYSKLCNIWNLISVIFTWKKYLESWVKVFWDCFKGSKLYFFHYFMKSVPIPGNQSSFEMLQTLDTWRYQSLVIFFLVLFYFNLKLIKWCLFCIAIQSKVD